MTRDRALAVASPLFDAALSAWTVTEEVTDGDVWAFAAMNPDDKRQMVSPIVVFVNRDGTAESMIYPAAVARLNRMEASTPTLPTGNPD